MFVSLDNNKISFDFDRSFTLQNSPFTTSVNLDFFSFFLIAFDTVLIAQIINDKCGTFHPPNSGKWNAELRIHICNVKNVFQFFKSYISLKANGYVHFFGQ